MQITSTRRPRSAAACALAAVAGLLALPGAALGWQAYMSEYRSGRWVVYQRGGEANDVRITRASPTSVRIEDHGRYIWSQWGWGGRYGCETANVSDHEGTFPALCSHPDGIDWVAVHLGDGADRLRVGASVPLTEVTADDGDDQIDIRDGAGGDLVLCRGGLDWALLDPGDRSHGCETWPLGGILTSGAAAAPGAAGTLHVLARGADHDLWVTTWSGTHWSGFNRVPGNGRLVGEPAVVSLGGGRLDVFVRGTDNQLYRTHYDGSRWSGHWQPLGGQLASAPAAVHSGGGRVDVFVRWSDGTLRQRYYWDPGGPAAGSGWVDLGGGLSSKPAAASAGYGRIDVFVRGTDDQLYQLSWDGSRWSAWTPRGGWLTSAPAAASRANGTLDVIARGAWNEVFQITYELGRWGEWRSIGGDVAGVNADPALVSWASGRLDAFVRVSDDSIYQLTLP